MRAVKAIGRVDKQGQIHLDEPLVDVNGPVEVIVLIGETEPDSEEASKDEILANFRQAWHEAMTGQTVPVSQIWEGIEHG